MQITSATAPGEMIPVAAFGPGVREIARIIGTTGVEFLVLGCDEEHSADSFVGVYKMGRAGRFATTNADPVWEDSDPDAFEALLAEVGIDIEALPR